MSSLPIVRLVTCAAAALALAAPRLDAQTLPDPTDTNVPDASQLRVSGFELTTGIVGPKNASTTIGIDGTLDLGMLRAPWLGLTTGVGFWSSAIDRSELDSNAKGTIRDLSLHTDVRWSAFKVKRVIPYLVTGLAVHRVSADIGNDPSLEDALTGTTLGTELGLGILKEGTGLGWRAEFRRRFAGDVDSWGLSVGARFSFSAPPARPATRQPDGFRGIDRTDPYGRPNAPGVRTASLDAMGMSTDPYAADYSATGPAESPEAAALLMLMDDNQALRQELGALREEMAAQNALAALGFQSAGTMPRVRARVPASQPPIDQPPAIDAYGDPRSASTVPATQYAYPSGDARGAATHNPTSAFPLAIGERRVIDRIALELDNPVADPNSRAALDVWGALIAASPDVHVRLFVHGADADPARALMVTERQARVLQSYLSVMGAAPHQVVAIGLGRSGATVRAGAVPSNFVEIERIR